MRRQLQHRERRHRRKRAGGRRVDRALRPAAAGADAVRYAYPGTGPAPEDDRRRTFVTGSFATLLHLGVLGFLFLLASIAPVIEEELIPLRLLHEEPPPPEEPAPAPRALAERRLPNFSPKVQTVAPQVVNPRVIAAASPAVQAEALDMEALQAVRAPTRIEHRSIAVERVARVNSIAAARAQSVDVPRVLGPAVRGPVALEAPVGASVGPKQVRAAQVQSIGAGALEIGSGSSVPQGIASSRDVLGSPAGSIVVDLDTAVGESYLRGSGGSGTGIAPDSEPEADLRCTQRPEVAAYMDRIRERTYARWRLPPGTPDSLVTLRFRIDVAGSANSVQLVSAQNNALGASAVDAMRAASPYPPMPEPARCLAGRWIRATFTSESVAG